MLHTHASFQTLEQRFESSERSHIRDLLHVYETIIIWLAGLSSKIVGSLQSAVRGEFKELQVKENLWGLSGLRGLKNRPRFR